MSKTPFYTCDVCGAEIDPQGPCHRAIEVSYPDAYVPGHDFSLAGRGARYVGACCLPLRHYRPTTPKERPVKATLWNLAMRYLRGES